MPPKKKQQVEEIKGSEEEPIAPKTKAKSTKQPATKKGTGRGTRRGGDSSDDDDDDDIDFEDFLEDEDHSASTKTGSRGAKARSHKVLRNNEATDVKEEQQRQSAVVSRAQRNKSKDTAQIVRDSVLYIGLVCRVK